MLEVSTEQVNPNLKRILCLGARAYICMWNTKTIGEGNFLKFLLCSRLHVCFFFLKIIFEKRIPDKSRTLRLRGVLIALLLHKSRGAKKAPLVLIKRRVRWTGDHLLFCHGSKGRILSLEVPTLWILSRSWGWACGKGLVERVSAVLVSLCQLYLISSFLTNKYIEGIILHGLLKIRQWICLQFGYWLKNIRRFNVGTRLTEKACLIPWTIYLCFEAQNCLETLWNRF